MELLLVAVLCFSAVFGHPTARDAMCTPENCVLADGCICLSTNSPIAREETPQFVVFTFDDSVSAMSYDQYYGPLLFERVNPNGQPISATFFVPHEYTDYEKVNSLYNKGFEIADHSISKSPLVSYWVEANLDLLVQEFDGQRKILSRFANIPIDDVQGARNPYLQLKNNLTFEAYVQAGLSYDNSWPTLSTRKLFPYTLDHLSNQQCMVGSCPTESFPGYFVAPINNIQGNSSKECNAIFSCEIQGTAQEIADWLIEQFQVPYTTKKAPQTFMLSSAWFQFTETAFDALNIFLDYLDTLDDVYLVSHKHVLDWMKDPKSLSEYAYVHQPKAADCKPVTCPLEHKQEIRYMRSCVECPAAYPWLGNPLGDA